MPVTAWKTVLTTLALGLGLVGSAHAQSAAFTDSQSGIAFQQVEGGDYTFGIALPENNPTDFIGRIGVQGSKGWAGVSLGGPMQKSLMVVAWPHQTKVVASLRSSTGYFSPGPHSNASVLLKPIPTGTFFNGTAYAYTFLCKGCIQADGTTFKADAKLGGLGYALAPGDVGSPANPLSPLSFHSSAYGLFEIDLAASRSPKFATWAALARDA